MSVVHIFHIRQVAQIRIAATSRRVHADHSCRCGRQRASRQPSSTNDISIGSHQRSGKQTCRKGEEECFQWVSSHAAQTLNQGWFQDSLASSCHPVRHKTTRWNFSLQRPCSAYNLASSGLIIGKSHAGTEALSFLPSSLSGAPVWHDFQF